jgi:hypothetical protein
VLERRLSLRADPVVEEGDFNLLFAVRSTWKEDATVRQSLVAAEKKVQVGLLGTESVGGFSLRLVALILPGLLLWLMLQVYPDPLLKGLATLEKAAFAVLTSSALVALAATFRPTGLARGMSLPRLGLLCLAGALVGLFAGGMAWLVEWARAGWEKRQQKRAGEERRARVVQPEDGAEVALGKLLAGGDAELVRNAVVRTLDGEELYGSVLGPAGEGKVLLGWLRIQGATPGQRALLEPLRKQGRWAELLQLAQREKLRIAAEPVQVKQAGAWVPDGRSVVPLAGLAAQEAGREKWAPISLA